MRGGEIVVNGEAGAQSGAGMRRAAMIAARRESRRRRRSAHAGGDDRWSWRDPVREGGAECAAGR